MAAHARPARPVRPIGRARTVARPARRVRAEDVIGFLVGNGLIIALLWWYHGGLDQLTTVAGIATATGQLTALYGTYLALIQLLLMSRAPALDRIFGRDQLTLAHRWIGFATVWLLVAHGVFTTVGFALDGGESPLAEFWTLNTTWDFVLMATVSLGLFIAVAVTSVRLARKRISYESWYGIHLYAYLAVALGFAHQLVVGRDFIDDPLARVYWVGLYVVVIGCLLAFRFWAPIALNLRHRFHVANVIAEGPGVWSVYLSGRGSRRDRHPRRPVPRRAVPGTRLVARPSVFDLRGTQRSLAPVHGQGARRRLVAARPAGRRHPGHRRGSVRQPDDRSTDRA